MKKAKRKRMEVAQQNAVVVKNPEFEFVKANDVLEDLDIKVDSILADDKGIKLSSTIRVEIPRKVYYRLLTYVKLLDQEITGLGYVERDGSCVFRITDIFLLKQVVSGAACKIDPDSQFALIKKLVDEGKDPSKLKCWWHSHANMGTFWSSTDEDTSKKAACDFYISIVLTHSGDILCKVNIYTPIAVELDGVKVIMVDDIPLENLIKECKEEVEQKVMVEKKVVYTRDDNWHNRWGNTQGELFNGTKDNKDDKKERQKIDPELSCFGQTFMVSDMTFKWNDEIKMYDVIRPDGVKLTFDEIEMQGLMDYADPLSYNNRSMMY